MVRTAGQTAYHDRRFARLVERLAALGRHRVLIGTLVAAAVAGALVLDVRFVSYPIAGLYLVPSRWPRSRCACARPSWSRWSASHSPSTSSSCKTGLDGPTITVVAFSALGGAALIALSYLFTQVGRFYETERSTSERLESLAAQLQTLQEVMVLDTDRPLSELLGKVIAQASTRAPAATAAACTGTSRRRPSCVWPRPRACSRAARQCL